MSICTTQEVMNRIKHADRESPIAVFRTEDDIYFDALFANTIPTQQRIKKGDRMYIGTFHKLNDPSTIRRKLKYPRAEIPFAGVFRGLKF